MPFFIFFFNFMHYNGEHDRKGLFMKTIRKYIQLLFVVCAVFAATAAFDVSAQATETDPTDVTYTTTYVKETIQMLPGETRMVSTIIPGDATYESSDRDVVAVSNSGQMIGGKPGTCTVTQTCRNEKTVYTVKVNGEVDLIVFAGQSNMCGSGGNASTAPRPDYGTAYEFDTTTKTKQLILMKEPFGEGTNRNNGLETNFQYSTKGTLVSAFCINYYKQTKTPVVGVTAAWGGSSTNTWLKRGLVKETQSRLKKAKKYLKKNNIKIRHIYMVWYQGESDGEKNLSASTYMSRMKKIYKKMKSTGVEKVFMIRIAHDAKHPGRNSTIMKAQKKLCAKNKNFVLVSKKASSFVKSYGKYYYDSVHLNQKALNIVGYEAGKAAGKYVKKLK